MAPMNATGTEHDVLRDGPTPGDALLVVDVQRDFMPGGRLAVAGATRIVPRVNAVLQRFQGLDLPIYASRDWHPPGHASFTVSGGPWPPHCVMHSEGAAFAPGLRLPDGVGLVSKGCLPDRDTASAFRGTDLHRRLAAGDVHRLVVVGLGTEGCVLQTVLDARALDLRVIVLRDAVMARAAGEGERALERMRAAGAEVLAAASWMHPARGSGSVTSANRSALGHAAIWLD